MACLFMVLNASLTLKWDCSLRQIKKKSILSICATAIDQSPKKPQKRFFHSILIVICFTNDYHTKCTFLNHQISTQNSTFNFLKAFQAQKPPKAIIFINFSNNFRQKKFLWKNAVHLNLN
jgi:hypothetical protein